MEIKKTKQKTTQLNSLVIVKKRKSTQYKSRSPG